MQIFAAFGILAASRAYIWVLSPCRTLPTPYCLSPHFYHSTNLLSLPYNSNSDLIPIAITLLTTTFTSALNAFASFSPTTSCFNARDQCHPKMRESDHLCTLPYSRRVSSLPQLLTVHTWWVAGLSRPLRSVESISLTWRTYRRLLSWRVAEFRILFVIVLGLNTCALLKWLSTNFYTDAICSVWAFSEMIALLLHCLCTCQCNLRLRTPSLLFPHIF